MSRLSRLIALTASATLVSGACQSSPPSPTAVPSRATDATDATAASFHPSFADAPCPDDVTNQVVTPATCGFLTVLEDRSKPAGRTIQLFVGRFDPPGGTTTTDPVISLGALAVQDDYGGMSPVGDRKSTRLNSSHEVPSRMPSSA